MKSTATLWIVSFLLAAVTTCVPGRPAASAAAATPASVTEARAVWIWGSTVRNAGVEAVADALQAAGITDAILLVKGTAGTVSYPSAIAPAAAPVDTLGPFTEACHSRGIRVHAWLNYHQDDDFSARTAKKYSIWHHGKFGAPAYPQNDGRVCPLRAQEGYNAYFLSIVDEILGRYPVDGIHLDYIRYPHTVYCFCPAHQAKAAGEGIDVAHVRALINRTYYTPADQKAYFNALASGDPDAVKWAALRAAEIEGVVRMVREAVDRHNAEQAGGGQPEVKVSAAFMPEGALSDMVTDLARNDQFALGHYAQDYAQLSKWLAFVAPMSYHKDYGKPAQWVGQVAAGAASRVGPNGTAVWAGIQTYSPPSPAPKLTTQDVVDALAAARLNGASGFALFRHGTTTPETWDAIVPTIEDLRAATAAAADAGWIDGEILVSLQQKLAAVQASVDAGRAHTARNVLGAYLNELGAQGGKGVDGRAATALAADARWVQDLLR